MKTDVAIYKWGTAVFVTILGLASMAAYAQSADAETGAAMWASSCGRCHNLRDPGDFSDSHWQPIVSHMRVRAGLTGDDARKILEFLQSSNDSLPSVVRVSSTQSQIPAGPLPEAFGSAKGGAAIYQANCLACHGKDGKGALPGVSDFTAVDGPLSKSDEELVNSIVKGVKTPGSPLAMPHHGGNPALTDDEVRDVLEYLREAFGLSR